MHTCECDENANIGLCHKLTYMHVSRTHIHECVTSSYTWMCHERIHMSVSRTQRYERVTTAYIGIWHKVIHVNMLHIAYATKCCAHSHTREYATHTLVHKVIHMNMLHICYTLFNDECITNIFSREYVTNSYIWVWYIWVCHERVHDRQNMNMSRTRDRKHMNISRTHTYEYVTNSYTEFLTNSWMRTCHNRSHVNVKTHTHKCVTHTHDWSHKFIH